MSELECFTYLCTLPSVQHPCACAPIHPHLHTHTHPPPTHTHTHTHTHYRWYTGKEQQTKGRSHAQLKYVDMSDKDVGASLWRRFSEVCRTIPVQDNFYLSWWLRGRRGFNPDSNPTFAPPFLTRDGFSKLKVRLCSVAPVGVVSHHYG